MRKNIFAVTGAAAVMAVLVGTIAWAMMPGTAAADGSQTWDGQGTTNGQPNKIICDAQTPPGTIHWIFTGGGADSATLTINGTDVYNGQKAGGGQSAYHFYTSWYELDPAVTIAVVTWTGDAGTNPQLTLSHACPPNGELSVEKTAALTYDRVCEWDVEKSADTDRVVLGPGESANVNYTVTVTASCEDGVDGEGTVSGTITIKNVGGLPVEDIGVVDTLNGSTIAVDCGEWDRTLDPGEEIVCTYSESQPIAGGSNHVAVSGTDTAGNATDDEFEAPYEDEGPANVILGCVSLSDTHPEAALSDELLCVDGDGNFEPAVYNYAVTVSMPEGTCTTFTVDNTAEIRDGDDLVDESSVTVTVSCRQEWCSPGYWRQPHHLDSWAATGISPDELYSDYFGSLTLSKKALNEGANPNPTLWQVLQSPQWYGGAAFNNVGDLLSAAHPDVDFFGERVEDSCPLN